MREQTIGDEKKICYLRAYERDWAEFQELSRGKRNAAEMFRELLREYRKRKKRPAEH